MLSYSESIEAAKNRRGAEKTDLPSTVEALHRFRALSGMSLMRSWVFWRAGARFDRSWLPSLIVVGGIATTMALSVSIDNQELDHIRRTIDGEAAAVSRAIQSTITSHFQSLLRITKRWEFRKPSMIEWEDDARLVREHSYGFEFIDWVDASYKTQWSVYTGGRKSIDTDGAFDEPLKIVLEKARQRQTIIVSRVIDLPPKGKGVLIYVPLFTGPDRASFDGFIAAALSVPATMTGLLDVNLLRRYELEIFEGETLIYTMPGAQGTTKNRWQQEADLKLYGVVWFGSVWTVRLWPTPTWLNEMHSSLDKITLITGLGLTGLLALLSYYFKLARERERQLQTANIKLRNEDAIKNSLREKEVLLKEIHHRVKNNLQIISSLLDLQTGTVKDPRVLQSFQESQHRIRSMALIHEKLYQSPDLAEVDFADYLRSLIAYLVRAYHISEAQVTLKLDTEPVRLRIDTAIPCGLILNELVSNALKHAFPNGRRGEIDVTVRAEKPERASLWVSDNGVGLPDGMDWRAAPSLGLRLVHTLTQQLHGTLEVETANGATFRLSFPLT